MPAPIERFHPEYAALLRDWKPLMPSDLRFVVQTLSHIAQADTRARESLAAEADVVISGPTQPFDPHESSLHPSLQELHAQRYARKYGFSSLFDPLPPL